MTADTFFFTYCLIVGTILGFVWRLFYRGDRREAFYWTLTTLALKFFLPIHIAGTLLKINASSKFEFATSLLIAGPACCGAVLLATLATARLVGSERMPHYPYIAATFAGAGRAVVLLAAAAPLLDTALHNTLDPRLLRNGGMIDALAIFDAAYWAFFTAVIYPFVMKWSFPLPGGDQHDGALTLNASRALVVVGMLVFVTEVFQQQILDFVGTQAIDKARLNFAAMIIIFSSAAVSLVAKGGALLPSLRAIGFVLVTRSIGLGILSLICLFAFPDQLKLLWLPMVIMLLAPPSSWIPQMLFSKGATELQRNEAAAINLAWNVLLYVAVAVLVVLASARTIGIFPL